MGWFSKTLIIVNLCMAVLLFLLLDVQGASLLKPGDMEYKDLVSILLTAVSVVVTGIGILVAVAAVWGYQSIKAVAEEKATTTSAEGCKTYLASDAFQKALDAAIKERMENEIQSRVQSALAPFIGQERSDVRAATGSAAGTSTAVAVGEEKTDRNQATSAGQEEVPWQEE